MYPILIIQTKNRIVVYIQGNKYIDKEELFPFDWMHIGGIALQLGIQDYNDHIRKLLIMDNEVSVGVDLSNFPDRIEYLPSEVINIVQNVSGEVDIVRNDVNEIKGDNREEENKCHQQTEEVKE